MKKINKQKSTNSKRIFVSLLCLVAVGLYLLPVIEHTQAPEPLADPLSLAKLDQGLSLPIPEDEPYGEFQGAKFATVPQLFPVQSRGVLGINDTNKRIEVDLTNQRVYAFEGNNKVNEFIVSTGKWGRTPTGTFTIWSKVRSQKMSGGSKERGTYYYLPNVPYVMFFHNNQIAKHRGFSFHGTYWHSNFGHPMSHGCVNMRTEDAQALYNWATPVVTNDKSWSTLSTSENPGTQVTIYGVAPKS